MDAQLIADPVLDRFRAGLDLAYGDRLDRALLFGSRARGDHKPDSDYDIAVFIHGPDRWLTEVKVLAGIGTDILLDTGAVISAKPFRAEAYNWDGALMREIRRDGVPF
jgi:predicted nucleotidyltransferase